MDRYSPRRDDDHHRPTRPARCWRRRQGPPPAWSDGLHHVLDARTGAPVDGVLATWVIADDAMLADGIATALFPTDAERLNRTDRFAFVRMCSDRIESSPGFNGELFT